MNQRPPFPPFSLETAKQKLRLAEDAWNTREPERVAMHTRKTAGGAIAPSSSRAARRLSLFSAELGL